jgi:hypothetical protein
MVNEGENEQAVNISSCKAEYVSRRPLWRYLLLLAILLSSRFLLSISLSLI